MSRSSRHARCLIPTLVASLTLPLAAHAAEAPTRDYAFDPSGVPVASAGLIGITQDASEVLFNNAEDPTVLNLRLLARNLRTNVTTVVLPADEHAYGASADNQVVLYDTDQALDPADANGAYDLYLLNRRTGSSTLVSRAPGAGGSAIGDVDVFTRGLISGDGQTVFFDSKGGGTSPQVLRFDASSRTVSVVGPGTLPRSERLGLTAGAVVTSEGIVAGGRTLPLPVAVAGYRRDRRQFRISDDGRTVADQNTDPTPQSTLGVTDTVTGVRRAVPLSAATGSDYQIVSVANGGATVTVGGYFTNPDTTTSGYIGRIATATGAVTRIGPLLPWNPVSPQTVVTRDEAFAALGTVSALGTTLVPGTPPAPAADALAYVHFYPGCSPGTFFQPAIKPSLALGAAAIGSNPRTPVSATVELINDDQSLSAGFTLAKGTRHSLPKANGGFTYVVKVTFSDGTTSKASNRIGTYVPIRNDTNPFTGARGACKKANGL